MSNLHASLTFLWFMLAFPQFVEGVETYAIISMKLDGSDVRMHAVDPTQNYGSVDISPDGKMLAFDASLPKFVNTDQWILITTIDGAKKRKVIKGGMPKWSPAGRLIAFQDYVNGVAVVDPDGSGKEPVSPRHGSPSWIRGGDGLAVLEWGRNIQVLDLISGDYRMLDKRGIPGVLWGFAVSKDGKNICYLQRTAQQGLKNLVVTDLDGSRLVEVTRKGDFEVGCGWHPDGKRVAFSERKQGWLQLFIMNVEDGSLTRVPGDKNQSYVSPCFSPDGERIYCSSTIRLGK